MWREAERYLKSNAVVGEYLADQLLLPLALGMLEGSAVNNIPWAWGINGCASVIGATLATTDDEGTVLLSSRGADDLGRTWPIDRLESGCRS